MNTEPPEEGTADAEGGFNHSLQSLSVFYSLKFPYKTKSNLMSILLRLLLRYSVDYSTAWVDLVLPIVPLPC